MKTTGKTKILAMIISIMMIVSMIPMGALAVSATPAGEAINSAADFAAMAADGTYYLAEDIKLSETYANVFTGTFDGNGNTVTTSVPMFGEVENATIQNFTVTGTAAITTGIEVAQDTQCGNANTAVGAVACVATDTSFAEITNNAKISIDATSNLWFCGGIVGVMLNATDATTETTVRFTNCVNTATITLSNANGNSGVGGIAGGCQSAKENITTIYIENCKNTVALIGAKAAGAVGYIQHAAVTVINFENTGSMSATGGIAGGVIGQIHGKPGQLNFENCSNSGECAGTFAAGIVGYINNGYGQSFIECNNSGNISGASYTGGIIGGIGTPKGETVLFGCSIFGCSNNGLVVDTTNYGGGIAGYLKISNCTVARCENKKAVTAPHAGGIVGWFEVIDSSMSECTNDATATITGIKAGGIIGQAQPNGLTVSNCVNNGDVNSNGKKQYIGGVIGWLYGTGTIDSCVNTGTVDVIDGVYGSQGAGGIAGHLSSGTAVVKNCYNTGDVKAGYTYVGGLVGVINTGASVINSYTSADVVGKSNGTNMFIGQIGVLFNTTGDAVSNNHYNSDKNANIEKYAFSGTDVNSDVSSTKSFISKDLASGKLAYDINTAAGQTVFYQNINELGAAKDANPVLDPTHGYVFKHNETLYSLAFYTLETASIRLDGVERAMRFATAVNKADYDNLPADVKGSISFGTLITPDDYLKAAGNDFTKTGLEKLDTTTPYLNVVPSDNGSGLFINELRGANNTDYYYFCGTISEIDQRNYEWDYSAIGYVTINGNTMYSGQYATRNIAYVANAALNDTAAGYTDAEKAIIGRYLLQD